MKARHLVHCALLAVAVFGADPVDAHTRSRSFSTWRVSDEIVTVLFSVRTFEATRLPRAAGERRDLTALLAAHVDEHLSAARGGAPCQALAAPRPLQAREGYLRLEQTFECVGAGPLTIENGTFFELAPSHVHIARVSFDDARPIEYVLTRDTQSHVVTLGDAGSDGAATLGAYVVLGAEHILAGLDHLAFLLGLLLLCRRVRDVVLMVTGFTLGHSLTLALAVLGVVEPDQMLVEALIGFTVALVAVENVAVTTGRARGFGVAGAAVLVLLSLGATAGLGPPVTMLVGLAIFTGCYLPLATSREQSARLRPALTVLFGLVHGFGFAGVLADIGLPPGRTLAALFGFNIGVEIGQLAVVALLAAVGVGISFALDGGDRDGDRGAVGDVGVVVGGRGLDRLTDPVSALLCGLGLFWFFSRAYA